MAQWRRWASDSFGYRLDVAETFTELFAEGRASYGDRQCMEFEDRWYSGGVPVPLESYASSLANVWSATLDGAWIIRPRAQQMTSIQPHAGGLPAKYAARLIEMS